MSVAENHTCRERLTDTRETGIRNPEGTKRRGRRCAYIHAEGG
jgi:hypothetical protein